MLQSMRLTFASTSRTLMQQNCPAMMVGSRRGLHISSEGAISTDKKNKDGKRKNGTMSLVDLQRSVWGVEAVATPQSSSVLGVGSRNNTSSINNVSVSQDQLSAIKKFSKSAGCIEQVGKSHGNASIAEIQKIVWGVEYVVPRTTPPSASA